MKLIVILASVAPALYLTVFCGTAAVLWSRTPDSSDPLPEHARILVIALGIFVVASLAIATRRRVRRHPLTLLAIGVIVVGMTYGAISAVANQFRYRPQPDHRFTAEMVDNRFMPTTRHVMLSGWRPSPLWFPSFLAWKMPVWLFPGTRRTMSGYMFDNEFWCKPCYYAWSTTLGMLMSLPLYGVMSQIAVKRRGRQEAQQEKCSV